MISKSTNLYKKEIKAKLKTLSDFTPGEENLIIIQALNISLEDLFLFDKLTSIQIKKIEKALKQRLKGKPLNKIFKNQTFFGKDFFINKFVLAPRKETEILVEKVLQYIKYKNKKLKILDLCCGSGIIGLTILDKTKNTHDVVLSDISLKALNVAKKNNKILKTKAKFVKSDLLKNLKGDKEFDIIICNPPYISTSDIKNLEIGVKKYDPKIALDGGKDGLKFYKKLSDTVQKFLKSQGALFLEIGQNQADQVSNLFKNDFEIECLKDYDNNDRVIVAKLKK